MRNFRVIQESKYLRGVSRSHVGRATWVSRLRSRLQRAPTAVPGELWKAINDVGRESAARAFEATGRPATGKGAASIRLLVNGWMGGLRALADKRLEREIRLNEQRRVAPWSRSPGAGISAPRTPPVRPLPAH